MPLRRTVLATDHYYHIYNRSTAKVPIFKEKRDYLRMMELIKYYQYTGAIISYSHLLQLSKIRQYQIIKDVSKGKRYVKFICYCVMPNHYHFILKQVKKDGIVTFSRNFQNSYAKYFNIKYKRVGSLFQNRFKAVLIENDEQLLHLTRYIHLNPYSSLLVKTYKELIKYPWSSYIQYLKKQKGFCDTEIILSRYREAQEYQSFVHDRADYQRNLERIKYLVKEKLDVRK